MSTIENRPVVVIGCKSFDSDLGGMTYLTFADTQNTRYFWRASGKFDVQVGSAVTLGGTITETRDDGSIALTRCTLDGRGAGALSGHLSPERPASNAVEPSYPNLEPSQPSDGDLGAAWGAADRGSSKIARVLLVILGFSCIIPFIGLLIGAIAIPLLIITAIVLLIRRAARSGSVQYGDSIVRQNLTWALISLGIAVVSLSIQIGFLVFLSAVVGG